MKKSAAAFAAAALAAGLVLAGCSSSSSSAASSGSASASSASASASASADSSSFAASVASEAANLLKVGNQTDTAKNIVFANRTGQPITNVALTPKGAEGEPAMLMAEGQQVGINEMVQVFVEPTEGMLYNATIVCADKTYTLHDLNLSLYNQADVALEGDIAYVRVNVNGNEVSSLREEAALAQQAAEEAKKQAEAEQQQQQQQSEEPQQTNEVYYEEPTYDSGSNTQSSPTQTGDSCVSDVVLR